MSEASSDGHSQPRQVAPPHSAQVVPRHADEEEEVDPRLEAVLSADNPVYPLDPPIADVRIPVEAPHSAATVYSRGALREQFPNAEVGDDLHMLFSEPDKAEQEGQSRLAPDIFVALNVPRDDGRGDYDADVLGPPDFVLEVLSRSTWEHDLGRKLDCYQKIGVHECLFFDATSAGRAREGAGQLASRSPQRGQREWAGSLATKELWGYALTPAHREPLREVVLPNGERGVRSEVLGLVAYVRDRMPPSGPDRVWALTMRWYDPVTGRNIPDYEEAIARLYAARACTAVERAGLAAEQGHADAARDWMDAARRWIAKLEEQLRRLDRS